MVETGLRFEDVKFFVVAMDGNGVMLGHESVDSRRFKTRNDFYEAVISKRRELAVEYPGAKLHIGAGDSLTSLIDAFQEIR